MTDTIHIDGSKGEGGGQILRSALSLSVLTGQPLRLTKIRAGRAKPGLMRQHLTCVQAAAQLSAADLRGAELRSTELEFRPNALVGGAHHFAIGTAGSTMLVLQTVLPILLRAEGPSRVCIEGGTHNQMAPSADFINALFLPLLRRMGAQVELEVERVGFYPTGGGRIVLQVSPSTLQPISLIERGALRAIEAQVLSAGLPQHIAMRELTTVADHYGLRREPLARTFREHSDLRAVTRSAPADRLDVEGTTPLPLSGPRTGSRHDLDALATNAHGRSGLVHIDLGPRAGTGNVLAVAAHFEHCSEWVTQYGQRGVRAEQVAQRACAELDQFLGHQGAVGEHLADQLLLPMVLAGAGEFSTGVVSEHLRSNAAVVEAFGVAKISIEADELGRRVSVVGAR